MPDTEPNRYVAKFKTSLVKRWSHKVLHSVSAAVPTPPQLPGGAPDYNVWSPVVAINAMEARLHRLAGNGNDAAVPTARLLTDAGLAPNQQHISGQVAEAGCSGS